MDEITLQIQHDEESGQLVASWIPRMAPAASLRKGKTCATCSTRSPRRWQRISLRAQLRGAFGSISEPRDFGKDIRLPHTLLPAYAEALE